MKVQSPEVQKLMDRVQKLIAAKLSGLSRVQKSLDRLEEVLDS